MSPSRTRTRVRVTAERAVLAAQRRARDRRSEQRGADYRS